MISLETLDLSPGRNFAPDITARLIRGLEVEDVAALALRPTGAGVPSKIQTIRSIHHHAARHLAAGMKVVEVAALTGLCPTTIGRYKKDPSFAELVTHYASQEDERYANIRDRMARLGEVAAEELMDRVLEKPDQIATDELIKLMTNGVDRSGHAPAQKHEHVHAHFAADEVSQMKEDIRREQTGKVSERDLDAINSTVTEPAPLQLSAPKDTGLSLGDLVLPGAGVQSQAASGQPGKGEGL